MEGRDQRKLLLTTGSIGLLAVISGFYLSTMLHLLLIYLIFFVSFALRIPAQNRVLQQHIPDKSQGSLFGIAQGSRYAVAAVISLAAGVWMDRVADGYRHMFLLTGIGGMIGLLLLASIPPGRQPTVPANKFSFSEPLMNAWRLLRRRPDFLRFEGAFMLYGVAFMMTLPVIPLFLVDDLDLSYSVIGTARGAVAQVTMILSLAFAGKWYDRSTPHRFSAVVFLILALHPIALIASQWFDGPMRLLMVFLSFAIWGVALGGVTIIWNLASLRFARNEDAGVYQSVHLAAVGIRGAFAPLLGLLVMHLLGKQTALIAASVLWIVSAIAMVAARLIDVRSGQAVSLRA